MNTDYDILYDIKYGTERFDKNDVSFNTRLQEMKNKGIIDSIGSCAKGENNPSHYVPLMYRELILTSTGENYFIYLEKKKNEEERIKEKEIKKKKRDSLFILLTFIVSCLALLVGILQYLSN